MKRMEGWPALRDPRRDYIEGSVETDLEKATRQQAKAEADRLKREADRLKREAEIKKARKEHADTCKKRLRELDKARLDYRLTRLATAITSTFSAALAAAWIIVTMIVTAGDHHGGQMAFYIIALIACTVADGIGLSMSISSAYSNHDKVIKSGHAYEDALENNMHYEAALIDAEEMRHTH